MKKLILILLLLPGLAFAANKNLNNLQDSFEINMGNGQSATGGFDRGSNVVMLGAARTNTANYGVSFTYASGTAYTIKTAPEKSTLIAMECICGAAGTADTKVYPFASTRIAANTGPADQAGDLNFFADTASQPWILFEYVPNTLSGNGLCSVSRILNIDLTAAFMPGRTHFGIKDTSTQFNSCTAWVRED